MKKAEALRLLDPTLRLPHPRRVTKMSSPKESIEVEVDNVPTCVCLLCDEDCMVKRSGLYRKWCAKHFKMACPEACKKEEAIVEALKKGKKTKTRS